MLLEVKKIDPTKRELKFQIAKERVTQKMEEVYKEITKVAKVKGFRPGKAPRQVIESEYHSYAREEVIKSLIPEVYREGIMKEKIDPMDMPDIRDVNFKDGTITFTANLDIRPEVKIADYKGIVVKRKSSQVTDEEINKTLEYLKQGRGQDKDAPLDDAIARGFGYPSLEEFKNALKRQMELDKDRHNQADVENQIVDDLLKKAKLTVPQGLIKKQAEARFNEAKERANKQGIKEEDFKKREEDVRKSVEEAAERDIKIYLILEKIADQEKIEIKEGENQSVKVIEYLLKEAKWETA